MFSQFKLRCFCYARLVPWYSLQHPMNPHSLDYGPLDAAHILSMHKP